MTEFHRRAVAVFDRQTNRYTESVDLHGRFRSASVIKLLIAIDYLRRPTTDKSPETLNRLRDMLALSHDAHADEFWRKIGRQAALPELRRLMGMSEISADPTHDPPWWGFTIVSAYDIVQLYRYLEDQFHATRDFVRTALASAPRTAADGFDQHFGIPGAFSGTWPIKQGWIDPTEPPASAPRDVDFSRRTLHTTGLVGPGDRTIVVVLTVHKPETTPARARSLVTDLTRSLNVPGAVRR